MRGKYRIESKLGDGGFATVYRAFDTLEGIRIALKVPYPHLVSPEWTEIFDVKSGSMPNSGILTFCR